MIASRQHDLSGCEKCMACSQHQAQGRKVPNMFQCNTLGAQMAVGFPHISINCMDKHDVVHPATSIGWTRDAKKKKVAFLFSNYLGSCRICRNNDEACCEYSLLA